MRYSQRARVRIGFKFGGQHVRLRIGLQTTVYGDDDDSQPPRRGDLLLGGGRDSRKEIRCHVSRADMDHIVGKRAREMNRTGHTFAV